MGLIFHQKGPEKGSASSSSWGFEAGGRLWVRQICLSRADRPQPILQWAIFADEAKRDIVD